MIYGYARVSTTNQHIDRQVEALKFEGVEKKNIFIDYESGKDFNRINYQKVKQKLKKGDLLIVKSLDRLGRNYQMIIEEWSDITKKKNTDIKVIDMPILDTRSKQDSLVAKVIVDIVLQLLSFVAQNERENIKQRQKEGIKIAKEKGIKFGRPNIKLPSIFNDIANMYLKSQISSFEACDILKMKRATFFRYLNKLKSTENIAKNH